MILNRIVTSTPCIVDVFNVNCDFIKLKRNATEDPILPIRVSVIAFSAGGKRKVSSGQINLAANAARDEIVSVPL